MIINQITRRLINGGISKGINMASSLGKGGQSNDPTGQSLQSKEDAKRNRKLARMARRNSKF